MKAKIQQWEYLQVMLRHDGTCRDVSKENESSFLSGETTLAELGANGWEAVSTFQSPMGIATPICCLMKRPKQAVPVRK